jgi:hypothetical protein
MRVAYVSTCGAGHLNTLRSLWKKWPQQQRRLFLLRFADEPLPVLEEETSSRDVIVLTCNQNKPSENATVFNETRRQLLQPALHVWLHDYRPTLIVYDFFCLEARVLSRVLGVPAICSIPATLRPGEKETCSDALLVKEHFYWVWRDPYPVAIEPVAFLGQRRRKCTRTFGHNAKIAVVTFGTVIPHYEGCKERLNQLMLQMERLVFRQKETTFIFAGIQGPAGRNTISYPDPEDCDLIDVFREAKPGLLIFHGGGNTYAEALAARVPKILVCPFFGDQFETARQEGNVYSDGGDLLEDVKKAKEHLYSEEVTIERHYPFNDRFPDYFRTGDLVFGHRRHRTALQKQFPQVNLHLEHYKPFADFAHPEVGELPAIADVYNDELGLLNSNSSSSSNSPYQERLLDVALARSSICQTLVSLPPDHRLVHYCLEILKLTIGKWKGRIHFVLGPSHELGPATQMELDYIERNWKDVCDAILFYNVWGERVPAPWSCPTKKKLENTPGPISLKENAMVRGLCSIPGRMPLVWGREKSYSSTVEKLSHRHLPLLDHYGWRTGYLDKEDLQKLQRALLPSWSVSVCWCRQRVWFYYYTKEHTEVQIWPWTYLHHFYLNQAGAETDMERQFKMQEEIEKL